MKLKTVDDIVHSKICYILSEQWNTLKLREHDRMTLFKFQKQLNSESLFNALSIIRDQTRINVNET